MSSSDERQPCRQHKPKRLGRIDEEMAQHVTQLRFTYRIYSRKQWRSLGFYTWIFIRKKVQCKYEIYRITRSERYLKWRTAAMNIRSPFFNLELVEYSENQPSITKPGKTGHRTNETGHISTPTQNHPVSILVSMTRQQATIPQC